MIKQSHIIIIAAAGILLLSGCGKKAEPETGAEISVKATIGQLTKVSNETDGKGTRFTAGDKIAVYGWTGGADAVPDTRVVDGVLNTLGDDGKWTPATQMRWKPGGEAHFFLGIYPAPESVGSFSAADYALDPSEYTESDLLVATNLKGVTASQGAVELAFDHIMARLDVNLKFRGEFVGTPTVTSVTALAMSAATVNYLTKEVTAKGNPSAVAIPAAESAPDGYALSFSGIQVPQQGVRKITITIGDKEYVYDSAGDIPLEAGKYTTLGLSVGKAGIELTGVTVSGWETVTDLSGGEAKMVITASNYLTFTSRGSSSLTCQNFGGNAPKLYYSTNTEDWAEWDYSKLTFTSNAPLYLCGDNLDGFSSSDFTYSTFVADGDAFSVSGDIMSLLNKDAALKKIPKDHCFIKLFYKCDKLTQAPDLPATALTESCYVYLFDSCTMLETVPELPATRLANSCYLGMFSGCTGLETVPASLLPAEELAPSCYQDMFTVCTSLTSTPALPATNLKEQCYKNMFYGCNRLTAAPDLPATVLADQCYTMMFYYCFNLKYVKCLAHDVKTRDTEDWLYAVSSNGTFVRDSECDWPRGSSGIPDYWSVEDAN